MMSDLALRTLEEDLRDPFYEPGTMKVRQLLQHIRELTTWFPIESAPLGEYILISDGKWVCEGYRCQDDGRQDEFYVANTHWTDACDGRVYPSHWRRLPEAPSETQQARREEQIK